MVFGNPFLITSTRLVHSSSEIAASEISVQLTEGMFVVPREAHIETAGSSMLLTAVLLSSLAGCLDVKSGPQFVVPGTWTTLNLYRRVFCFSWDTLGFGIVSRERSLRMLTNG